MRENFILSSDKNNGYPSFTDSVDLDNTDFYKNKNQYNHKQDYTLDVYTDTIYDYVIVTTVANNGNNIGVSSIIVNDICDFSNNN